MKQSKHTTSYWHKLMGVVLLVSVVLCNLVGLVSAKFVQDIDAGSITVAKNYYTVTYYNSNNTVMHTVTELLTEDHEVLSLADVEQYGNTTLKTPDGVGEFQYWVNAAGKQVETLTQRVDYYLYPSFKDRYSVRFIDDGILTLEATFTVGQTADQAGIETPTPRTPEGFAFTGWVVVSNDTTTAWDDYDLSQATADVLVYATYSYAGDVSLIPVENNGDGVIDEYHVSGYGNTDGEIMVEIPAYVNGIPVTTIDENAFAKFADLHCILIPNTITSIENFAVAEDYWYGLGADTVTIYYQGTRDEWIEKEKTFTSDWDTGLGDGSRIFFLGEDGKVDISQGYLQAKYRKSWGITVGVDWNKADITDDLIKTMKGACTCPDCNNATRPDAVYWSNIPTPV